MIHSHEDFVARFRRMETQELLERLATGELTDVATGALRDVVCERGMSASDFDERLRQAKKGVYRKAGRKGCDYCRQSTLLSSVKDAGQTFCSSECLQMARLMEAAVDLDPNDIPARALAIRNGPCPRCGRRGSPVEVRRAYWIWSAVVFTRWGTSAKLCCKGCGNDENLRSMGSSFVLGWWGFPWGILRTPVQVIANVVAIFRRDPEMPSDELMEAARLELAAELLAAQQPRDAFRPMASAGTGS